MSYGDEDDTETVMTFTCSMDDYRDEDQAAHVADSHELRETEDERRENEFIAWQAAYMADEVRSERHSEPRWAHTALVELTRQGREHPTWLSFGWWDDIIARAEDMAEADGSAYVYEHHVVLARQAKEAHHA